MDCSSPDSSVHGILQADILEWVAIPFSRGPFRPRDQIWVSWIGRQTVCHLSQASCATSLGLIIVIHRTALIILTIQPSVCFKKTKASCWPRSPAKAGSHRPVLLVLVSFAGDAVSGQDPLVSYHFPFRVGLYSEHFWEGCLCEAVLFWWKRTGLMISPSLVDRNSRKMER